MKNAITNRRRRERGMTLAEALIAVLVFSIVFLAALMLYNTANRAYIATDSATIQQQNARFAMDRMMNTLRSAGAGYNVTGTSSPDEQIEFADQSAIFVRGDFNNQRETALQNTAHPYVTVGNNEIVGYILRRPGDDSVNTTAINMRFDTTTTGGRNATLSGTTPGGEEPVAARAVVKDLSQTWNPPYQLVRVTFDDAGSPVYDVVADNVFRMSFVYTKADGTQMTTYGGADTDRAERALIRKIDVNLITMADKADFRYTDPNTYTPAEGAATKRYRKFNLSEFVVASNLGLKGKRHSASPPLEIAAPPTLTVCTGHDRAFYLSWGASPTAGVTDYEVHVQGAAPIVNDLVYVTSATSLRYQQKLDEQTIQALTFTVNGKSGAYSGLTSPAVTKTSTHDAASVPSPVANMQFTAPGDNTLSLTWDPVRTSTGTITASTCTTMPGGTASAPPSPWNNEAPDLREYHVYRKILTTTNGANGGFTPTDTNPPAGTRVDNYSVGGGMTNTTPMTDSLSETSSALIDHTAAPCGRYFYRAIGFDSEPRPTSISGAGSAAWSTPASYLARAGVTPEKPATPGPTATGVVTSGGNYTLTVQWQPDLKDSTGAAAYTAHYRLYTERALSGSPSTWSAVPGIGQRDYYETYQIAAPDILPINPPGFGSQTASYRYKVEAIYDCNDIGDAARPNASDWYTVTCTFTPTVAATGTSIGNGTPANPWELDFPDYVQVSPPAGVTIANVTFTMKEDTTGTVISGPTTVSTAPFRFQYFNQQDLTIYRLEIQATSSTGCTYSGIYYIKDAPPTPACLLGTSTSVGPTSSIPNGNCGNKIITSTMSYTVPNTSSTDDLALKQIQVQWAMDSAHADATIQGITFPSNQTVFPTTNGCTTASGVCSGNTGLVNVPAAAAAVIRSTSSYTITFDWDYNKCDNAITSTPITSICLVYTSTSTGATQRFCNLVGGTSNNPGSCN